MASNAKVPGADAPLAMMEKLSTNTFIYRPSQSAAAAAAVAAPEGDASFSSPKLILVASWKNTQDVHIAKYITKYQALFPATPILLIKCFGYHFRQPHTAVEQIQPAVPAVRAALESGGGGRSDVGSRSDAPSLLVHAFSNGGSSMVDHLYNAYRERARAGESPMLPAHVTIFDSTPGYWTLRRGVAAFTAGISGWLGYLVLPLVYLSLILYHLRQFPFRRPDPLKQLGLNHNDRDKNGTEVRRAYIYSEDDKLIDWRNVEDNATDAQEKGFRVRLEKFTKSPHVAHARTDPERYWSIVKEMWEGVE